MPAKQIPSRDTFVLVPGTVLGGSAAADLSALGSVEDLGEGQLLLQVRDPAPDARATWQRLQVQAGVQHRVHPVLLDERGNAHYPTGEVTVRFRSAPSDAELRAFANAHALDLRGRNEFVGEQAVFLPRDAARTYVPDLVEELSRAEKVQSAWANTRSRYRRA